ncbi:alpha/beta fold hydrolase [Streptomyces sp. NPDC051940]|uniref:alpha/beta hydrolase family protein n=1 Tax=Streptomyces sp. NPDC051940 TaxID=3155675 RepID=UPI00343C255C
MTAELLPLATAVATDDALFTLHGLPQADPSAPVVLLSPAMGTPARFYRPLAAELHRAGLTPVVLEQRGQGERSHHTEDFGYAELIDDLEAAIAGLRAAYPVAPLAVLGHSLGGQLALLQAARGAGTRRPAPDAVAVVAAGSVWYRAFGALGGAGVLAFSQFAGLTARLLGRWPGHRLGFGGRQPARIMRDWARTSRTGRYEVGGTDYEALLRRLHLPVLAVGVAGDSYAPPGAVSHLVGKVPGARLEEWRYTASRAGGRRLDHFRWVRHGAGVADHVAEWMGRAARALPQA